MKRILNKLVPCALWVGLGACGTDSGPSGPDDDGTDGAGNEAGVPGDAATALECEVPSEPDALLAYLRNGAYKEFSHESAPHPSTGPHGREVLTYLNPLLEDSLAADNAEHPACSAAVKELFLGDNPEVGGWAVYVKNREQSAQGQGYYWYEITSTAAGSEPDYAGQGLALCVNCHEAGQDFVRIPFPLR